VIQVRKLKSPTCVMQAPGGTLMAGTPAMLCIGVYTAGAGDGEERVTESATVHWWRGRFAALARRALVPGRVSLLAGIGVVIGGVPGLGLSSAVSGIPFGVEVTDSLTMVAVTSGIGLTALPASLSPLRQAVGVSPAETLRRAKRLPGRNCPGTRFRSRGYD
jgi:hypothetical protein